VKAIIGDAGGEMVEPHHERDDDANLTDGHEELIRSARATADGTTILAIGGRPGTAFEVSRWERALYP
jgi:hypothetical protein